MRYEYLVVTSPKFSSKIPARERIVKYTEYLNAFGNSGFSFLTEKNGYILLEKKYA